MCADSHAGPQRLGKYELRELLGRGGMAQVWKAYDTQLERYVAIKLLHSDLQADPEFITRFSREARVIASLHHPNIVLIHDLQISRTSESNNPIAYMVMDYVEGQTLANYIRTTSHIGKFPPPEDIVHLFASISRAIDYAHQHGMIHRDIKPANVLLDKRNTKQNPMGEPVLTDFGLAKLMGVTSGTVSGTWLGTPLYISPEQAQGHPGNERSDIYSLGVILYEACAGVPPFMGESIQAIMMQHIISMPISPALVNPTISPRLSMVILRGLAKNPADRFSNAPAMTAALAKALNIPIPADMSPPLYPVDVMSGPTFLSPTRPNILSNMASSSPSLPTIGSEQLPQPISPSAQQLAVSLSAEQPSPTGHVLQTPGGSSFTSPAKPSQTLMPAESPTSTTPAPPSSPLALRKQRRGLLFWLIISIIAIGVLGPSLGAFYWLTQTRNVPAVATKQIIGHAFFISSGQVYEHNNQGINDELLTVLHNIPDPSPGKSYYAWLLSDTTHPLSPPVSLGKLPAINGDVHYLYPGDTHHTNLIAITSRFLITEEDANLTPINPSPDKSVWRYYTEFPQMPETMDMMHEGPLQHIRHLLADAPELTSVGLPGGLDIWLFRNTEKMYEWAGSARDSWERQEVSVIQRQLIRILDYLDGKVYVQQDVPAGTPNLVNPRIAPLALLEFDPQNQQPPGLLYLIGIHLSALVLAPGISKESHALAAQIDQESNNVQSRLEQVRKDAKKLLTMTPAQLLSRPTLSILDDMETAARYAFIGQIDPNTNQVQGGTVQIHDNMPRLATYDIALYQSH